MEGVEKFIEENISLSVSMYNPAAESIARAAYKAGKSEIDESLQQKLIRLTKDYNDLQNEKHVNPCGDWNSDVHMCQMYEYECALHREHDQLSRAVGLIKLFNGILKKLGQESSELCKEADELLKEVN